MGLHWETFSACRKFSKPIQIGVLDKIYTVRRSLCIYFVCTAHVTFALYAGSGSSRVNSMFAAEKKQTSQFVVLSMKVTEMYYQYQGISKT